MQPQPSLGAEDTCREIIALRACVAELAAYIRRRQSDVEPVPGERRVIRGRLRMSWHVDASDQF
jgi:hypothetical protein